MILFAKYGIKFYTTRTNPIGEQGETEGCLRRLVERGVPVAYFGQMEGSVPGVLHIQPELEELNDCSLPAWQEELWNRDVAKLKDYGFKAAVQINGMAPTFSWIRNPNFARLQSFAVRYCGPWLNAVQSLGLPRICINNDPRSYPKDQEMSYGWDHCVPAALLDQTSGVKNVTIGGKKYARHSYYAACESHGYLPERQNTLETECTIVAHSHFDDGIRSKAKWEELQDFFDRFPNLRVYGKGWPDEERYPGPVSPNEVLDLVNRAMTSYICDHTPGFKTGKPYVLTSQGCIPCYSLHQACEAVRSYADHLGAAKERYQPNFKVFDDVIDSVMDGSFVPGRWGGYAR